MDNETQKCVVYKRPYHLMTKQMQKMRDQDELCDVTIEVGEQSFRAHKVILAAAMNYFREMFLRNSKKVDEKVIWVVPGIKPENMETFIDFAYSGEIKLTEKSVQSLLIDANFLGLTDIKTDGMRFIESILNPLNAFSTYELGQTLECLRLMEKSQGIITSNFSEAVKTREFLDISFEFLGDILKSENVQLGSSEVAFDGAMKWMAHSIEERKHYLSRLLELVNLPDLNTDYLMGYFFKAEMTVMSNDHKDLVYTVMSQYHQNKRRNVVNHGIINNHPSFLLALQWDNKHLSFETYDSQTDEWEQLDWNPELADSVRSSHVYDDVVYLSTMAGDAYIIDVRHRSVEKLPTMQESLRIQVIIVLGGFLYNYTSTLSNNSYVWTRYCLKSKQWNTTISPVKAEGVLSQFTTCQGYIYAIESDESNRVHRYCPQTDKWEVVHDGRDDDASHFFGSAVLNGKIYICGEKIDDVVSNTVECFDPETKRWQRLASMNQARIWHSVVACNGKLWAIGGNDEIFGTSLSSVEVYDPISNSWSMASSMKKIRGPVSGGVLSSVHCN